MNKKFILPIVTSLLVILLVGVGFMYRDLLFDSGINDFDKSDEETLFSLRANDTFEDFVTKAGSSFTLDSKVELSESDVRELVSFEPEIEFKVEKQGGILSMIPQAKAQGAELNSNATYSYTLTPSVELPKGELLVANIESNRDYSWAFAVEADFQVISSLPRNRGTYVPIDSSIEIEFNEDVTEGDASFVSVEPSLDYDVRVEDEKLVLVHAGMQEGTVYTVTVDQALFDERDSSFGEDFVFTFETSSEAYNERGINFWSDYESFFPGGDKFFSIGYTELDTEGFNEDYTTSIYRYESTEDFMEEYGQSKNWNWYWTSIYKNSFDDELSLEKATKLYEVSPEIVEQNYSRVLYLADELETGTYAIEIENSNNGDRSIVWFQVSPLAHYYTYTSETGLLWLYDFENGSFLDGADVSLIGGGETTDLGRTNEKGLLNYNAPDYLKERSEGMGDNRPSSFMVEWNGETYLSMMEDSNWYGFYYPKADRYWNFLSSDRYVYRPTDEINFWGVVKGREDDLKNDKVTVSLTGGSYYYYGYWDDNKLASSTAVVSSFDTIKGSLSFEGIEPGYYTLQVEKDDEVISTSSLQIVDFETPAYQLIATPSRDSMFAGETVDIEVEAKFFDGTPVPNLEVQYSDYISQNYYNNSESTLQLDENGQGVISATAYRSDDEFSYGPNSRNIYLRTGSPEQGEISAQTEVLVFEEDVYMQLINDVSSDDDLYNLTAKLNEVNLANATSDSRGYYRSEFIGDPDTGKGVTATIYGTYYEKIEDGFYYDPVSKTSQQQYRYEFRENFLTSKQGVTNGEGEFEFTFEPTEQQKDLYTSYYVILSSTDDRGVNFETKNYIGYRSFGFYDDSRITLSLNSRSQEPELKIGEEFELELDVPEEKTLQSEEYLYYGYQTAIDDFEVTPSENVSKVFKEEFIPGFAYQAVVLTETGFEDTNRVIASYDELQSELSINMQTDKDRYRPGERVEIEMEVTDVNGDPVKAEVNLASVDEALFHVLPYEYEKDILSTLYIDNIDSPQSGANKNERLEAANMDAGAEQGGCFLPGTMVLMSNGESKPIEEVRVGDQVLSFANENSGNKKIVTVQGVHSYLVDGYMIINDELEVTGEHEIFLNGKWRLAGMAEVGDELIGENGEIVRIEKIEYVNKPATRVYNLNVDKTHTYFADGIYVHNAEKGGAERSEFKDVSLFDTFETNAGGSATAFFDLPDNLTSWRISAKAFENERILAGQDNIKVPVSLPVFAATSINDTYLLEDKPVMEIRAYGEDLVIGDEIDYVLEIESLGILEEVTSSETSYGFQIEELQLGIHEAKLTVRQGDNADTLVLPFEVIESYGQRLAFEDVLIDSTGAVGLEVPAEGMVDLELATVGKGKFLPELRSGLYVVNNRLDQIVTRNYIVDLMSEQFGNNEPEKIDLNLNDYYVPDNNGLALFTYGDADLELTALVSDILGDDILKAKTSSYLREQMVNKTADIERTSIALYGLASLGENVLAELKEVARSSENTKLGEIYVALGLEKMGDKEGARAMYNNSISSDLVEGQFTQLNNLLRARIGLPVDGEALEVFESDGSVYGIAGVMAMEKVISNVELVESLVSLRIGDEVMEFDLSDGFSRYEKITKAQAEALEVESIDGEVMLVASYRESGDLAGNSQNLSISKRYLVDGVETSQFESGDLVRVVIDIEDSIYNEDEYKNYQIIDYLPSGLRPVINNVTRYQFNSETCSYNWYGGKSVGNVITFSRSSYSLERYNNCNDGEISYFARVVSDGEFKVQGAQIKEYDADNVARGEDGNITIR